MSIMFGQIATPLDMAQAIQAPAASAKKRIGSEKVPDELVEQILSKLPARKVEQLQLACKGWEALISTSHFMALHSNQWCKNFVSEVLIARQVPQLYNPNKMIPLEVELSPIPSAPRDRTASWFSFRLENLRSAASSSRSQKTLSFSALGFVVFQDQWFSWSCFVILNSLTREKVKLMVAREDVELCGQVYAIFLHPKLQEICVLWGQRERFSAVTIEFKLLNLQSFLKADTSCWRKIVPRLHRYRPRSHLNRLLPPVILDNVLYWMVDSDKGGVSCEDAILAFDVEREEFQMLSHPGRSNCAGIHHQKMHLLQTKSEHLSLCEFSEADEFISTWERRSGKWIRMHRVRNHHLLRSPPGLYGCYTVLGMVDKDTVLLAKQGTESVLYVVDLKHGTVEAMEGGSGKNVHFFVFAHTPTFATITSSSCKGSNSHQGEVLVQVPPSVPAISRRKGVIY